MKNYQIIDTLNYRGFVLHFFMNDDRQEIFTIIDNSLVYFGQCNADYKKDACNLVDLKLDVISQISPEGKLLWFQNGGYRDIKLIYKTRIVKIWLVTNPKLVNLTKIKQDAEGIILKLSKLDENI